MDLGKLAAITIVDVYFGCTLAAFSLALWLARRYVGWLLKLVPATLAALGTVTSYGTWRVGDHMSWDSPGSPAILVVYFALGGSIACGLVGWVAFAIQTTRWFRRGMRPSSPLPGGDNSIRVAFAIVIIVSALFSAYRYFRSHQSSHDTDVMRLAYSPDGEFLYSLDAMGMLKKWNVRYHYEARRWQLAIDPLGVTAMLASGDGKTLVLLRAAELRSWALAAAPEAMPGASLPDVVAIAPVDGAEFVALRAHELTLRTYADAAHAKSSQPLGSAALGAAACGERKIVVGTEDAKLRFYVVTSALDELVAPPLPPLGVLPREIRADRTGTHVVVADGAKKMVVLDLQNGREDAVAQYWLPATFEVSGAGELLLAQIGITGYELATRSTQPIFNRGGAISALAVSPRGDDLAIANRREIWVRANSRDYAAPEVWLNGRAQLALAPLRIRVAALLGGTRAGY